jgi:hypothetical protein
VVLSPARQVLFHTRFLTIPITLPVGVKFIHRRGLRYLIAVTQEESSCWNRESESTGVLIGFIGNPKPWLSSNDEPLFGIAVARQRASRYMETCRVPVICLSD